MLGVKYFEGLRSVEHDPWYLFRERPTIAIIAAMRSIN